MHCLILWYRKLEVNRAEGNQESESAHSLSNTAFMMANLYQKFQLHFVCLLE